MRTFTRLYEELDRTTSTNRKVDAIVEYLRQAPARDAAWAVHLLAGQRPKRLIGSAALRRWIVDATGLPEWLVVESHSAVGDLAETAALLCSGSSGGAIRPLEGTALATSGSEQGDPESLAASASTSSEFLFEMAADPSSASLPPAEAALAEWMLSLDGLRGIGDLQQRTQVVDAWRRLPAAQAFIFTKLLTGALRVGVSKTLVERALAKYAGVTQALMAQRLAGDWRPSAAAFVALVAPEAAPVAGSGPGSGWGSGEGFPLAQPLPFFLASPIEGDPTALGAIDEWLLEWKWDGIRAQLLRRDGDVAIWSRGEELVTERFPELVEAGWRLPAGTIVDGEILAWRDERPLPFAILQTRIGRRAIGRKSLVEAPVSFMTFDLLAVEGEDRRERPLRERRGRLEVLLTDVHPRLRISPRLCPASWADAALLRSESRARGVEGLLLKRLDSPYRTGRRRGDWWKWKIGPLTIDAVMVYAQPGRGRRANLHTDYTFALWHDGELTPFAKAYSGLDDEEIKILDSWIRANTTERFGPVRAVAPKQVFELGFEGVQRSTRHRSGFAVRFPRILRWRRDKQAEEADRLASLEEMVTGGDGN